MLSSRHYYTLESRGKPGKYMTVEGYAWANHNVAAKDSTGKSDQQFLFVPSSVLGKFQIVSLREDVHDRILVSVGSDSNIVTWADETVKTQSFDVYQDGENVVAITHDSRKNYLNVDNNTNIHLRESVHGRPKEAQRFRLRRGSEVVFPEEPPELVSFRTEEPEKFNTVMSHMGRLRIDPAVAKEMKEKLKEEHWRMIYDKFSPSDKSSKEAKTQWLRDLLLSLLFSEIFAAAVELALITLMAALLAAATMFFVALAVIGFLLAMFVAFVGFAASLIWIWWKDPPPAELKMLPA